MHLPHIPYLLRLPLRRLDFLLHDLVHLCLLHRLSEPLCDLHLLIIFLDPLGMNLVLLFSKLVEVFDLMFFEVSDRLMLFFALLQCVRDQFFLALRDLGIVFLQSFVKVGF